MYEHALYYVGKDDKSAVVKTADKVKVAKLICEQPANLGLLDLGDRVEEVVQLIRNANS
jgi:hypothetical protein